MPHWSVDEQSVPMEGGSLKFEVDHEDFAVVHLLVLKEDGTGSDLKFNRNGAYLGASKVEKPKDEPAADAAVEASGAKAADDEDEGEHHKRGRRRY